MYWSYLPFLISNLSFDEERISVELNDRIMGTIDFAKTNILRMNQQIENAVVCTDNNKKSTNKWPVSNTSSELLIQIEAESIH
jgi:ATP-dependent protease HslVU (ClpYQ) ATPase subunit